MIYCQRIYIGVAPFWCGAFLRYDKKSGAGDFYLSPAPDFYIVNLPK